MISIQYFDTVPKGLQGQINRIIKLVEKEGVVHTEKEVFIERPVHRWEGEGKDRERITTYEPVEHIVVYLESGMVLNLEACSWRIVTALPKKKVKQRPKRWSKIKYVGSNRSAGRVPGPPVFYKKKPVDGGTILPMLKGLPVYWEKTGKMWSLTECYWGLTFGKDLSKELVLDRVKRAGREKVIKALLRSSREVDLLWHASAEDYACTLGD